ncbi:hypothetical protein [Botrimarina sp.]|uniref:hypothetical protein n=1 Tax=Botrimarina sp. TaxID=2795802 RepID=UPI0032EF2184
MNSDNTTRRWFLALALLCVAALTGCGYGPVSPTGYEYAKAVYSLSNRQSADRVEEVRGRIEAAREAGELPPHEAEWLEDICDDCGAGRWDKAQAAARRMMEDQVSR